MNGWIKDNSSTVSSKQRAMIKAKPNCESFEQQLTFWTITHFLDNNSLFDLQLTFWPTTHFMDDNSLFDLQLTFLTTTHYIDSLLTFSTHYSLYLLTTHFSDSLLTFMTHNLQSTRNLLFWLTTHHSTKINTHQLWAQMSSFAGKNIFCKGDI